MSQGEGKNLGSKEKKANLRERKDECSGVCSPVTPSERKRTGREDEQAKWRDD